MAGLILTILIVMQGAVDIELWVDKEEPIYHVNEYLRVFFKTDVDCYVAVYDIEVGGEEYRLFPPDGDDGWVTAGRVYELPGDAADYEYLIGGPSGIETIIACASTVHPPGLHDDNEDVTRRTVEIYIQEPEPAKLRFISTPDDCRIYITDVVTDDTEYVGRAPRTVVIRPGDYIIEIKRAGFYTLKRRITVDPDDRRRIFVKLTPY
ncbi:DUF4384 domain-containing protein [candidate division WOR-3 bacterium]|nr:DUF4384 domain-containing protein [candidate division WOR-3 bacterium]